MLLECWNSEEPCPKAVSGHQLHTPQSHWPISAPRGKVTLSTSASYPCISFPWGDEGEAEPPAGSLLYKCFNAQPREEPAQPDCLLHGEHDVPTTCQKCLLFYSTFTALDQTKSTTLEHTTREHSASHMWHDALKIPITACSAKRVLARASPDKSTSSLSLSVIRDPTCSCTLHFLGIFLLGSDFRLSELQFLSAFLQFPPCSLWQL